MGHIKIQLMHIIFLTGMLSVSFITGQSLNKKDDPIRVQVKTVNILVSVHDKDTGEFIKGLTKKDFEVYEDGRLNPITNYVEETNLPLSIALCSRNWTPACRGRDFSIRCDLPCFGTENDRGAGT